MAATGGEGGHDPSLDLEIFGNVVIDGPAAGPTEPSIPDAESPHPKGGI